MAFDVRKIDLAKLNSMTKYPSILTYHALADKGRFRRRCRFRSPVESSARRRWTAPTPG